ncbi:unnamed protein product [Triticum turgidum subsp. durum]|uniref:Major facilitator superfamily (MFS) profile domain-containing protein n=1 Tax=Triticum turgidum subsp. durum TaxID=4567 RepID=A0A9R0TCF8_TRITD|nr:unnamed protein product [Triticum turgidum subsp. durum]
MAIGGAFVEGPAGYSGRVTSFVVLSCIVAGSGGILFGYDLGISGGVTSMESFLKKFFPDVYHQMHGDKAAAVSNYCRFDSELLTVFTSSLYVAGLVATLFASSVTASNISRAIKNPYRNILKKKYRPQLVIALLIPFFNQVTGINVINFYAPVMFRTIGLGESAALMSAVVTRLCATVANIVAMVVVDKFGRRKLLLVGGVQMILSQFTVGAILAVKFKDHGVMDKEYGYLVLVIMCVFVAGFAWSWGPLTYLVPTEICPLEIRSAGQSVVIAVIFLMTFVIGQTFLNMLCHLKFGTFFLFGGWVCVMTLFVFFFLPETKQLPMEQMEQVWRRHWFWKRIVGEGEEEADQAQTGAGAIAMSAAAHSS